MPRERYKGNVGTIEPLITTTVQRPGEIRAEQEMLACILAKNKTYWDGAHTLREEHFLDPYTVAIFRPMKRLIEAGEVADYTTLSPYLMPPALEEVRGWSAYHAELIAVHFNSHLSVPGCVKTIIEMSKRRVALDIHQEGFHNALGADPDLTADEQIMRSLEALSDLAAIDGNQVKGASAGESLQEALDHSEAIARGDLSPGLSFGMPKLEEMIGPLQDSWFYVLGGRPGHGKSALVKQMVIGAGRTLRQELMDVPNLFGDPPPGVVLFFTLEMTRQQVSAWMGSEMANVSNSALRGRPKTDAEAVALIAATAELKALPIELIDGAGNPMTIQEVVARTRAIDAKRTNGPVRLVVVDHVQKLLRAGEARDQTAATAKITSALKDLARSLKRPVIALAHLNKDVGRREDGAPQLEDLKHAGEEDADVVFFLQRPEVSISASPPEPLPTDNDKTIANRRDHWHKRRAKWKNRAQLNIGKRREGDGPREIILGFRGETTSFYEIGTTSSNIGAEDADGLPF